MHCTARDKFLKGEATNSCSKLRRWAATLANRLDQTTSNDNQEKVDDYNNAMSNIDSFDATTYKVDTTVIDNAYYYIINIK